MIFKLYVFLMLSTHFVCLKQHPSMAIVKGAGLVMKAIIEVRQQFLSYFSM